VQFSSGEIFNKKRFDKILMFQFSLSWKTLQKKSLNHLKNLNLRPVTVLKPLCGFDENLSTNLETFFNLDYPKYEIVFCVENRKDPAIEIAQKLIQKYPQIDARLVIGGSNVGVNPKINNMNPAYESAKYDLIWISDDRMFVQVNTLLDLIDCLSQKDNIVMVNQLCYFFGNSLIDILNKTVFALSFNINMFAAQVIKFRKAMGGSCLFEKKIMDSIGGLKYFGNSLAEDAAMITKIYELGYEIAIGRLLVIQNSSEKGFATQFKRYLRWLRLTVRGNEGLFVALFFV
jgi:ceramide glucosyltransferase